MAGTQVTSVGDAHTDEPREVPKEMMMFDQVFHHSFDKASTIVSSHPSLQVHALSLGDDTPYCWSVGAGRQSEGDRIVSLCLEPHRNGAVLRYVCSVMPPRECGKRRVARIHREGTVGSIAELDDLCRWGEVVVRPTLQVS